MRYRLRTLLIVVAIAPVMVWATTLWLALLMELARYRRYQSSGRGSFASESANVAKTPKMPGP